MPFILSISGSTILSESSRLPELFNWGCRAVEMGSFSDDQDYQYVLQECRARWMLLAIHSPFYQNGNRYGLLQNEPSAWAELKRDLSVAQRDGLAYVLVHFPYFQTELRDEIVETIRLAAAKMTVLSREYQIPILIEPKLGPNRDPSILLLLHTLPLQELRGWGLSWCLDIGDIYLASEQSGVSYLDMISHLAPLAQAVHLHDVVVKGEQYFWTPVTGENTIPIAATLALLQSPERDIFLVFEHTPHLVESEEQIRKGIAWLQEQLC